VIQEWMCAVTTSFQRIEERHEIAFHDYFATELEALKPLANDGLIELGPDAIAVTARGRLLVRTVAMVFDRHLREQRESARYSRVI
jgi:oxygen-independent coproporphyrinogen-3 oxidase